MKRSRVRSALVLAGVAATFALVEFFQRGIVQPQAEAEAPVAEPAPAATPAPEPAPASVEFDEMAEPALSPEDQAFLREAGWEERVGERLGIWVSVPRQRFYLLRGFRPVLEMPCATAAAGTGFVEDSLQTPLGWHEIAEKIGDGAPWGRIFRARAATDEIWQPGTYPEEDLVLTRLLWLKGLEPGRNQGQDAQGRNVDSKARFIYIHGTNHEDRIGTPSSHGCIRLTNDDVITVYDRVPEGAPVLITD